MTLLCYFMSFDIHEFLHILGSAVQWLNSCRRSCSMVEQRQAQLFNGWTAAGAAVQWLKGRFAAVQPLNGCAHGPMTGLGTDHVKGVGQWEAWKNALDGAEPHTSPQMDMRHVIISDNQLNCCHFICLLRLSHNDQKITPLLSPSCNFFKLTPPPPLAAPPLF